MRDTLCNPLGTRLGRKRGVKIRSTPHQPDDDHPNRGRDDADDAQLTIRHGQRGRDGALGALRKGREHEALDREDEADRGEKIRHRKPVRRRTARVAYLGAAG